MCVGFLSEEAELCLLSLLLLSVRLALVGLFWSGFCASSWGTCGFPRHALQLVTLSGLRNFWLLLAGLLLQWTFVVGWRCLGTLLGFLPCACAASPAAAYP